MKASVSVPVLAAALCALASAPALAQEKGADKKGKAPPAMSAEEKAAMEAMAKFGTPGEEHKRLEPMAGKWTAKTTFWPMPGKPPKTSTGKSENRWVLGGRWLEQRFEGDMDGHKFEGLGYTGYDLFQKEYVGTWMDTMSTSLMVMKGTADESGRVFTQTGTAPDPMAGRVQTYRSVTKIEGPDRHLFEMWGPGPDGKEFKMMEMTYDRVK